MEAKKNYKWNEFGKLKTSAELSDFFEQRLFEHTEYCHYTKIMALESILEKRVFWLNNVSRFNDKKELEQFTGKEKYFSLCFSTGANENLALWYLYAGMTGQGGRLRFTKSQFRNLLSQATFSLVQIDDNDESKTVGEAILLEEGKTMHLRAQDVLYCNKRENENAKTVNLKYNTQTNFTVPKDEFRAFAIHNNGFLKGIIWFYEKETRILVEIMGDALRQMQPDKRYRVEMSIADKVMNKFKIDFAPEIEQGDLERILNQNQYLRAYMQSTSNIKLSQYSGTIKMNLCNKCEKNQ